MAEKIKQKISTFEIPAEKNEDWHDDIDVDYATYGNEKQEREYISPSEVGKENKENIEEIKAKNQKLGRIALFNMDSKLAS